MKPQQERPGVSSAHGIFSRGYRARFVRFSAVFTGALAVFGGTQIPPEDGANPFSDTALALTMDAASDATAFGFELARPFMLNEKTLLLTQLSGSKGDEDFGILSAGLAARRLIGNSGMFAGANDFYDALSDSNGFTYSQLGLGMELTKGRWTLRGNGYIPLGDHDDSRTQKRNRHRTESGLATDARGRLAQSFTTVEWSDTTTSSRSGAWSWEVELEYALRKEPAFLDPRIAVGYYHVGGSHSSQEYSGLKVRGELRVGQHFVADAEWLQDARGLGQEWRAGVRWEFVLGGPGERKIADTRPQSAPVARREPGNGKGVIPLNDGKSGPPLEPEPISPAEPEGFRRPVKRSPWPNVLTSEHTEPRGKMRHAPTIYTINGPATAKDCHCHSKAQLIFD